MAEINEAYDSLSNPEKRKKYDMFGQAGMSEGFGGGQPNYGRGADFGDFFSGGFGGSVFDDLINTFFGRNSDTVFTRRGNTTSEERRGADISFEVSIDLEDAINGKKIEAELERFEVCEECKGTGAKKGTSEIVCPTCKGTGKVAQIQNTVFGSFRSVAVCPECGGRGKIIKEKCSSCNGTGRVKRRRRVKLEIPKAVVDGTKIKYRSMGNAGERGGEAGDLYLYVKIKSHPIFERRGNDLIYKTKISFPQAVFGTTLNIQTPYGNETLRILPGTESGKEYTIQGKGMPYPGNPNRRGNFIVKIDVNIPSSAKLNKDAKKLVEELGKYI